MEPRRFVQLASAIFSGGSALVLLWRVRRYRWRSRYIMIAPIICFTHISIYYLAVFLFSGGPNLDFIWWGVNFSFNAWSAGVTFHAVITMIFLSWTISKLCNANE